MASVTNLCSRVIYLEDGTVCTDSVPTTAINSYVHDSTTSSSAPLAERTDRRGSGTIRFTSIRGLAVDGADPQSPIRSGHGVRFELQFRGNPIAEHDRLSIALLFHSANGTLLFTTFTHFLNQDFFGIGADTMLICEMPCLPLAVGKYQVSLWSSLNGQEADVVDAAIELMVAEGNFFGSGRSVRPYNHGSVLVEHSWRMEPQS